MVEDIKPRQLVKQIPGGTFFYSAVTGSSTAYPGGWEIIESTAGIVGNYYVYRTYIDLAGYAVDDLTMFTKGVDIQKQAHPFTLGINAAQNWNEYDILSTRALTDDECKIFVTENEAPGFSTSTVDLQQVIYGEVDQLAINQQIPRSFVRINRDTFGSGVPTAMDKLHWTRICFGHDSGEGDTWQCYPTNLVIDAVTAKEEDLVWIERVRRSYQLQEAL